MANAGPFVIQIFEPKRTKPMAEPSKTKVVHCKIEPFDVYVGRGSVWGNKWSHKEGTQAEFIVATREEAIAKYREWIQTQPQMLARLKELKGKTLGCWCKHPKNPLACHGDVLAELADQIPDDAVKDWLDD